MGASREWRWASDQEHRLIPEVDPEVAAELERLALERARKLAYSYRFSWGAERVTGYLTVYNTIRPHEAIGFGIPLARYLQAPSIPPRANLHSPVTVSDS